jgi:hypothetical protein
MAGLSPHDRNTAEIQMRNSNRHEPIKTVERRLEIEKALARYPHLSAETIRDVVSWFKREASAMEVASLASNPDIHDNYRAFRKAHVDRFTTAEKIVTTGIGAAVIAALGAAMTLG